MATQSMLTTVDNPYNPFTHFAEWYEYDESKGYCSSGLLARIVVTSDELTDEEQHLAIDQAIDRIISLHANGIYKKITNMDSAT